jgi:hypothetical protein
MAPIASSAALVPMPARVSGATTVSARASLSQIVTLGSAESPRITPVM